MRFNRFSTKWIVSLTALAAAGATVASTGCGGGGGGGNGGSGGNNPKIEVAGKVTDQANDAISGYTVSFDGDNTYKTTTNSTGGFSISGIPTSVLTGSDYLIVSDSTGTVVADYSLAGVDSNDLNIDITIGPPAPPTSLAGKK